MNIEDSMEDMCRTCMKLLSKTKRAIDKKQNIQEVPTGCQMNTSIMELLQVVYPQIKIDINDDLPRQMCSECIRKLVVSHEFIEMYKKVDMQFRKMFTELNNIKCNFDYEEKADSLDIVEEDSRGMETKYEFEIEEINIECLPKLEEDITGSADCKDEPLHELFDETENKETLFLHPYSDASDDEFTPDQSWHEISSKKLNLHHEVKNDATNLNSTKRHRKKRKENKEKLPLPANNDDDTVVCPDCGSVFDNVQLCQEHMQQHQTEKSTKRKYTKRLNATSKIQSNNKQFECEYCGKGFTKISLYKNHMRLHSNKIKRKEQTYLCIECGKSFTNVGGLNTHMLRHKGEKTYQCEHCPKKFVCSSGLYGHMMVHTKEKPYVCDICGSAFHMAYQLRKHNLYHNGIKNYQCEYCDMRFVTREKQRRHMRTHTGEKPYRCKYCERAFAQSNDCIKHLRQHLGDNVYQCELCPLRFPLARDLRKHFATHKDDDEETHSRNLEARREAEKDLLIKLGSKELK